MRLHYTPNTISIVVAIALSEANLDFDAVKVSFADAEQTKAPYLKLNPKGRVPALEVGGTVLTETGALVEYVAAMAPEAGLIPSDPLKAAQMRSVMYYLASTMHVNHAHGMRGSRWADAQESFEDMAAKVPETMAACAAYIEGEILGDEPLIFGTEPTLADFYLFVVCNWLPGDGVAIDAYPKLTRFMAAMEDRASVKSMRAQGMLT